MSEPRTYASLAEVVADPNPSDPIRLRLHDAGAPFVVEISLSDALRGAADPKRYPMTVRIPHVYTAVPASDVPTTPDQGLRFSFVTLTEPAAMAKAAELGIDARVSIKVDVRALPPHYRAALNAQIADFLDQYGVS